MKFTLAEVLLLVVGPAPGVVATGVVGAGAGVTGFSAVFRQAFPLVFQPVL
ncbi:hypothetical protein [Paraflavitalea speifideaquila]|uniref:hypothetical protein n=1 Tax=Paraflavitalea speifideaquila TaxID=3076558 RepID=UPI0028EFA52C|nr:hypothetical protein [Paraflavitalea speifideiaquila]